MRGPIWTYGLSMSGLGDREISCIFVPLNWGTYHKCTFGNSHPLCQAVVQQSSLDHILFRQQGIQFLDMQPFHLKKGTVLTETGPFSPVIILSKQQFYLRFDILTVVTTKITVFVMKHNVLWSVVVHLKDECSTILLNVCIHPQNAWHHIPTVIFSCLFY